MAGQKGSGAVEMGRREAQTQPMGSFIPINQSCITTNPTVASESSHKHNDIDIHTERAVPKKRSRKPVPKLPLPRAVSLGRVWDYADEGDTSAQNSGADFQPAVPKRRKAIPSKRTQSSTAITQDVNQGKDKANQVYNEMDVVGENEKGFPLYAPPNTTKKRRATSILRAGAEKQARLFRNPTITKAAAMSNTKFELREAAASSNISYQGWTSTQDAVRDCPNDLAQTTLQKLAAFRYNKAQEDEHLLSKEIMIPSQNICRPVSITPEHAPTSSDYGGLPSSDTFLQDALHVTHEINELAKAQNDDYNKSKTNQLDKGHSTSSLDIYSIEGVDVPFNQAGFNDTSKPANVTSASILARNPSQLSEGDSPTSSEAAILKALAGSSQYNNVDDNVHQQLLEAIPASEDLQVEPGVEIRKGSIPTEQPRATIPLTHTLPSTATDGKLPGEVNCNHSSVDADTWIQVSHLGPKISEHWVRGEPNEDGFDEGIDDDDLLALAWPPVIATQPEDIPMISQVTAEAEDIPSISHTYHYPISIRSSLSPPLLAAAEFPDTDLEEAMVNLPVPQPGIEETFAPSSVLHFPFDDDSVTQEIYDSHLKYSPPRSSSSSRILQQGNVRSHMSRAGREDPDPLKIGEDWSFIRRNAEKQQIITGPSALDCHQKVTINNDRATQKANALPSKPRPHPKLPQLLNIPNTSRIRVLDEYLPLPQFARPKFPALIRDRSPVLGLSGQTFLRVCFRIGELIKEGGRCNSLGQDAIIELFARVTFSSREDGTTRQHFQFADLFHDHPPFPNGILPNYKTSGLAESESKIFIGKGETMARCLGRLVRDKKGMCWALNIINIRPTDWEEVRWTKRIVSGDNSDAIEMKT